MTAEAFNWQLKAVAEATAGRLVGGDVPISGVCTDTRHLSPGDLFVALRGEHFDGHTFVAQAEAKGAAAVVVDQQVSSELPQLVVDDTRRALGTMAAAWRQQHDVKLIAVTGSNGKTTVKAMISAIVGNEAPVLATKGNLNNDIGVPLTLLGLRSSHRFAVIEMGANHQGEIAYLTRLARPDVALITNAGAAHLEGFGSFQGVACAKGEIYEGLDDSGTAIINEDDAFAGYWRAICEPHRCLGFALNADTDITAQYELTSKGSHVRLNTPAGPCEAHLALLGEHNVRNALAATAASLAAGCTLQSVTRGLESIKPVARRLELKPGLAGSSIIDDTYNANPSSLSAALKVLHGYPGTHYLALGDMGELGDNSCQLHHDAGVEARDSGVSRLYTLGEWAACAADGFGEMAQRFSDQAGMVQAIKETLSEEVTLLVKGSRSMRMDEVVDALTAGGGGM